MNSEIQKHILNYLIRMPINRKKEKKSIYVYNAISEQYFNKIICCFPDCDYSKNNIKISNDCVINSFDYFDLILLFNINLDIENKITSIIDILSEKGELWVMCFHVAEVEKRIKNNIFDFSEKIPKIISKNDEIMKETLEVIDMILFPKKAEPPISPKSRKLLEAQINKTEDIIYEQIDPNIYSKSSSYIGNKIKFYVIKKKKTIS